MGGRQDVDRRFEVSEVVCGGGMGWAGFWFIFLYDNRRGGEVQPRSAGIKQMLLKAELYSLIGSCQLIALENESCAQLPSWYGNL